MAGRSVFSDVGVDLRRSLRPTAIIVGIALAVFVLIGGGAVGIFYTIANQTTQTPKKLSSSVPLDQYTSGMLQAFNCVRVGPSSCPEYSQATKFVSTSTPQEGLAYTPNAADAPGSVSQDGTRTVVLNSQTTKSQWHEVAVAVTRNGQATRATVPPDSVTIKDEVHTVYSVPARSDAQPVTGAMQFSATQSGIELVSVTYPISSSNEPDG